MAYLKPCPGSYTSRFGPRTHPVTGRRSTHQGLDIAAPAGTPVKSCAAGTIRTSSTDPTRGQYVIVDHGGGMATLYQHLSARLVAQGAKVKAGQVLGRVGTSGLSTGPHLHLEVWKGGTPVNPEPYLSGATPAPKPGPGPSIDQLARDVIAGKYGNGDARRRALGARYDAVQARVNAMLRGK